MSNDIAIVSAARTPMGGFLGELAGASAPQLGRRRNPGGGRARGHCSPTTSRK